MHQPLDGRVVVVTGGFGALGRALGSVLFERGARVALLDRAETPARIEHSDDAVLALGGVDLGSPPDAEAAFAQVVRRWEKIDGLVNVAGGFAWEAVAEGSIDAWDRLYATNLRSAVVASKAAMPHLAANGHIVNIGALAALKGSAGMGAYAASKAGVMRFTESLAEELKERGITVNAVLPSIIDTQANRADMPNADFSRWVAPDALARVVAFLLSDDAAPITGACIPVAGRV